MHSSHIGPVIRKAFHAITSSCLYTILGLNPSHIVSLRRSWRWFPVFLNMFNHFHIYLGPLLITWINSVAPWISNIHTCPFPNCDGAIWEWIGNFILQLMIGVITYQCCDRSWSTLVERLLALFYFRRHKHRALSPMKTHPPKTMKIMRFTHPHLPPTAFGCWL